MTGGQPLIKSIFWLFRGNVAYKETHKKHGSLDRLNSQASTVHMGQESCKTRKTGDRKIYNQNEEIVSDQQVSEGKTG
jgi:hypothetical protein